MGELTVGGSWFPWSENPDMGHPPRSYFDLAHDPKPLFLCLSFPSQLLSHRCLLLLGFFLQQVSQSLGCSGQPILEVVNNELNLVFLGAYKGLIRSEEHTSEHQSR